MSTTVLWKLRKVTTIVRKSSIVQTIVFAEIKAEGLEIKNLSPDFHVRWNSTFLMIDKTLKAKNIFNKITVSAGTITGLTSAQIEKLNNCTLSSEEWKYLEILHHNLEPFFEATKMLSSRNLPTFSTAKFVECSLFNFIENASTAKTFPGTSPTTAILFEREKMLRENLLSKMKQHIQDKITMHQKKNTLIAAYLDPRTNDCLTDEEKIDVGKELLKLFPTVRASPRLSSNAQTSVHILHTIFSPLKILI